MKEILDVEIIFGKTRNIKEVDATLNALKVWKDNEVKKDQDGYFCDVCFDGTKPTFGIQQSGVFIFDKDNDNTTEKTQSTVLRNLKKHIKYHIDSKVHQQKVDILASKSQKEKELKRKRKLELRLLAWMCLGLDTME